MKRYTKDILLIGCLLVLCIGAWLMLRPQSEGGQVVVTVDGIEVGRYSLTEEQTIPISSENDGINVLTIKDGTASITEANCGDHTCVNTGAVSHSGASIICLPHKVIVTIEGGKNSDVDLSTN